MMTREKLITQLADVMEMPEHYFKGQNVQLPFGEQLDSLTALALIGYFDETLKKQITFEDLKALEVLDDLLKLAEA